MKRQDRLFQKSVAGKSRHLPAGYNRRIAYTLNSLPDTVPCTSEETTVNVITHKKNYRYIAAISAATLIMIAGSAYIRSSITSGDGQKNSDPKTTVVVTTVPVTSVSEADKVSKPSVTHQTTLPHTTGKISGTLDHDIAGDPEQINKNNDSVKVTQVAVKDKNDSVVTNKADKVENTKQPSGKGPVVQNPDLKVTEAPDHPIPVVTGTDVQLPDKPQGNEGKDEGKVNNGDPKEEGSGKDDEGNKKHEDDLPGNKQGPGDKKPSKEHALPEHFAGENNVGNKSSDLPENMAKEIERIQNEIEKALESSEKIHDLPDQNLPHIQQWENQFQCPQN